MILSALTSYILLGIIIVIFISTMTLIPLFKFTISWEVYKKLYRPIVLQLLFLVLIGIIHLGFLGLLGTDNEQFFEFFEVLVFAGILSVTIYMARSLSSEYVLLKTTKELEIKLKERSRELLDSEEKYRTVSDTVADALVMVDSEAKVLFWNPAAERIFGYTAEEAIGASLPSLIVPERYQESLATGFRHFRGTGEGPFLGKTVELTAKRKDGTEFPVSHSISAVRVGDGWGAVGITHDITERKRAESANEELGRILEDSLNEIYIFDAVTLKFVRVNAGACKNLGYSIKELAGLTPLDIKPEFTLDSFRSLLDPVWTGKQKRVDFETLHKRKDGTLYPVEVHIQSSTYESTPVYVAIILDITKRKRAEEVVLQETETTKNLLRISATTGRTEDMGEFINNVVMVTKDMINSELVLSYLWDPATKTFRPAEAAGLTREMAPVFRTESIGLEVELLKRALDAKTVIAWTTPTGTEPPQDGGLADLFSWLEDVHCVAIIPLAGKRAYLGLIICICRTQASGECHCLSERNRGLMQAVSTQVSTALEEALHYKESIKRAMDLSHKVETIQTMHEIDKAILSATDSQEILETAVKMITRIIRCDRCTVATVNKEAGGFSYAAGLGITALKKGELVPFGDTNATEIIETLRPQYLADLREVKDLPLLERRFLEEGFLSHIRVPLMLRGEAAGVLSVGSKQAAAFTPEDLSTLEKLSTQIGVALEKARLVTDLEDFSIGTIRALAETIDAKSPWTSGHSDRVTEIAIRISSEMGLRDEEVRDMRVAGLLHDIGKIGTYEGILDKQGRLTEKEIEEMRKHPVRGAEILAPIKQLTHILPAIRGHHEFYDGTGYPDGLKGTDIPRQARILAVADTVDAMGADRPYRKGLSQEKISAELKRCSGTQFDPEVVEAYFKTLEKEGAQDQGVTS